LTLKFSILKFSRKSPPLPEIAITQTFSLQPSEIPRSRQIKIWKTFGGIEQYQGKEFAKPRKKLGISLEKLGKIWSSAAPLPLRGMKRRAKRGGRTGLPYPRIRRP
jgi:hypothetical protein